MLAPAPSTSGTVSIAPKVLKPAPGPSGNAFKPIAPDAMGKH